MTNIPYEERIKNRSNDWYYNKCIQQYYFIIKAEGANQRYKEEIKRLTKAKETTENEYGDLLKIFCESTTEYKKEIARLNKIIDEFEKELKSDLDVYICGRQNGKTFRYAEKLVKSMLLEKLKELKEEGK